MAVLVCKECGEEFESIDEANDHFRQELPSFKATGFRHEGFDLKEET